MKALHQILAQQRQLMVFQIGAVRTSEQARNDTVIARCTSTGVMRPEGFAYNPEHPHIQRVPCEHAGGVGEETLMQAGMAVMLHSARVASAQAAATYPRAA